MTMTTWAEAVARRSLESPLPRRWAHTEGVAAAAQSLSGILGPDADLIVAAAWLHDIGYSPALSVSGFHPLDGARYLRDGEHAPGLVCSLVAHHSRAITEARERDLARELGREFPPPPASLLDALTYCDMTTSPSGQPTAVQERIAEIHARYGPGHVVSRAISQSALLLTAAVMRVERKLSDRSVR